MCYKKSFIYLGLNDAYCSKFYIPVRMPEYLEFSFFSVLVGTGEAGSGLTLDDLALDVMLPLLRVFCVAKLGATNGD